MGVTEADDVRLFLSGGADEVVDAELRLVQMTVRDEDPLAGNLNNLRRRQSRAPVAVAANRNDRNVLDGFLQIFYFRSAVSAVDDHFGVRLLLQGAHQRTRVAVGIGKNKNTHKFLRSIFKPHA